MEVNIYNVITSIISIISLILSVYALKRTLCNNTSLLYLYFISRYASEKMLHSLRKLDEIKSGKYMLKQWKKDMKDEKEQAVEYDLARRHVKYFYDTLAFLSMDGLISQQFVKRICKKKGTWLYLDVVEDMEEYFDRDYDKKPYREIRNICENLRKAEEVYPPKKE